MSRPVIKAFLIGLAIGIDIAWLLESLLVGWGIVSKYLAPIAIAVPIIAAFLPQRKKQ